MRTLGTNIAAGETTRSFRTTLRGEIWLDVQSDTDAQPVTIEISHDNVNFDPLRADGVVQNMTTNNLQVFWLPGGVYLRVAVDAGAADTVDCRVDGSGLKIND